MKIPFNITLFLSVVVTCCSSSNKKNRGHRKSHTNTRLSSRQTEEKECPSVLDTICKMKNTKIFCELIKKASETYKELGDRLNGSMIYTVFAPIDKAFERSEEQLFQLPSEEMYRTLLFHFYEDKNVTYDDLKCSDKMVSLTGDMSRTKCQKVSTGVYIKNQRGKGNKELGNHPTVDIKQRITCAGVVHRIDRVMLPTLFTAFQQVEPEENEESLDDEGRTSEEVEVVVDVDDDVDDVAVDVVVVENEIPEDDSNESSNGVEEIHDEDTNVTGSTNVEKINNDVLLIIEKDQDSISYFDFDTEGENGTEQENHKDNEEAIPILYVGFDDDGELSDYLSYIPGTQILMYRNPDSEPVAVETGELMIETADAAIEEESEESTKLGAKGITLIIFSFLLLCFMFSCLRK
mmetsp:Transcript_29914/g.64060  ORF Transcript_29914/g.64060 Transcript_29914/m.64060 type:complete len:406 (+) Transcript_29914:358-1575(+)